MQTAVQYCRFSSKKQQDGRSEERQSEAGRAWCEVNGYRHKIIVDRGKSGTGEARTIGNLRKFLDDVEAGRYPKGTVVIVENLDRLSREHLMVAVHLATGLIIQGMAITVIDTEGVSQPKVYSDPDSFTELLDMGMGFKAAREENEKKRKRVKDAWDSIRGKAYQGRPVTATVPYGYKVAGRVRDAMAKIIDPGKMVIDEDRAQVVKAIFELTSQNWSANAIARLLNGGRVEAVKERRKSRMKPLPKVDLPFSLPVDPPGRRTKSNINTVQWSQPTIRFILKNRSYLGEYQPHTGSVKKRTRKPMGPPIPDYYPTIISDESWEAAHRKIKANSSGKRTHRMGDTNLLTSINRCGCCKTLGSLSVKQRNKGGARRFRCRQAANGTGRCTYREIPAEDVELSVLLAIRQAIDPAAITRNLESTDKGMTLMAERDDLTEKIRASQKEAESVERWAVENRVTGRILETAMADVERHLHAANDAKESLEEVENALAGMRELNSGLVQIAKDFDGLLPWVVGGGLPLRVNTDAVADEAPELLKNPKALGEKLGEALVQAIDASEDDAPEKRKGARVQVKEMIRSVLAEIEIHLINEVYKITMADGRVLEGKILTMDHWMAYRMMQSTEVPDWLNLGSIG